MPEPTPSQTIGPFFHFGLIREGQNVLTADPDGRIRITGRVLDAESAPVSDAMVEIWQADQHGHYPGPDAQAEGFPGFGRAATDGEGGFWFDTVKPGTTTDQHGRDQAPHIAVSLFARGLLKRLYTRIYFEDEPANAHDPVLGSIPQASARASLLARRAPETALPTYHFDIVLQGSGETAFFDI